MCHCTPGKRTPVCERCPEYVKEAWGHRLEAKMDAKVYAGEDALRAEGYLAGLEAAAKICAELGRDYAEHGSEWMVARDCAYAIRGARLNAKVNK
jgi:hypothetical protein